MELKDKNATDFTDSTDSKSLADDTFELERPGAEVEDQRQPEYRFCCDFPRSDSPFRLHPAVGGLTSGASSVI
jgi:hypothetical protein